MFQQKRKTMASLGIAKIDNFSWEGGGTFALNMSYVGVVGTTPASGSWSLTGLTPNITSGVLQLAVANQAKTLLISSFGYSFGLLDYVSVLGAVL